MWKSEEHRKAYIREAADMPWADWAAALDKINSWVWRRTIDGGDEFLARDIQRERVRRKHEKPG